MFLLKILKPALRATNENVLFPRFSYFHNSGPSLSKYSVVSLYHLSKVDNVDKALYRVRKWLHRKGATGRFHINSQGINCQLCFQCEEQVETLR